MLRHHWPPLGSILACLRPVANPVHLAVQWVKDLCQSLERRVWIGLNVMALKGLVARERKEILKHMHGMVGSKIRLERGKNGEVKVGNDWEVDGKRM